MSGLTVLKRPPLISDGLAVLLLIAAAGAALAADGSCTYPRTRTSASSGRPRD